MKTDLFNSLCSSSCSPWRQTCSTVSAPLAAAHKDRPVQQSLLPYLQTMKTDLSNSPWRQTCPCSSSCRPWRQTCPTVPAPLAADHDARPFQQSLLLHLQTASVARWGSARLNSGRHGNQSPQSLVQSCKWLQNGCSRGCTARRLASWGPVLGLVGLMSV